MTKKDIEKALLGVEETKTIEQQVEDAQAERERLPEIIEDFSQVPEGEKFSNKVIYKIYNVKQKTKHIMAGNQAYAFKNNPNYVLEFDHYER
jgi:hypothetical protein